MIPAQVAGQGRPVDETWQPDLPEEGAYSPDIGGHVIKVTEHWVVSVVPMIYNDRVLLSGHHEWRTGWSAGFCYDKGGAAVLAALAWNPDSEQYPIGYKKIAADSR